MKDQNEKAQRKAAKLAETIALYNNLPNEALVPVQVVCALLGRSRTSVWRDVKAGLCPAPVKAGLRSTRWRVGDLRKAAA